VQGGAQHGEHHAGQSCTGPDVDELTALGQQFRYHRAVEEMPVPQPVGLTRADEAARHPVGGKQFRVSARLSERITKYADGLGRRLFGQNNPNP
jgi:hypothetical protein